MTKLIFIFSVFFVTLSEVHAQTDTTLVVKHLKAITKTEGYRNHANIALLDKTAGYIASVFRQYADTTYFQSYEAKGKIYKNVICRFGSSIDRPIIVAGAHYDVCGDQEGADDNASGVTALLELARMLKNAVLSRPVELVAYSLEEPPYFRTPYMGSNVHAQFLRMSGTPVYGMFAIEMIGFFSDEEGSQSYPLKPMKMVYGTKGNYILLVKRSGYGEFVKNFSARFKDAKTIETGNLKAPSKFRGVDFSDHMNYRNADYDALMVTNTAFYRNKNYHQVTDQLETLDIRKMSKVIDAICYALVNIDKSPETKTGSKFKKSL